MTLNELQRLAEGAQPGPWLFRGKSNALYTHPTLGSGYQYGKYVLTLSCDDDNSPEQERTIDYIAAMSPGTAKKLIAVARAGLALLPVLDEYLAHRGPEEERLRNALEELK